MAAYHIKLMLFLFSTHLLLLLLCLHLLCEQPAFLHLLALARLAAHCPPITVREHRVLDILLILVSL